MRLKDRVIIITGASAGMGKATAQLFGSEGAKVIALARRKERLDELENEAAEKGQIIMGLTADVSNSGDTERAIKFAAEKFGRLDVLVNNAGIMDNMVAAHELTDELWDKVIDVNLTGPMRLCRAALNIMLEQKSGVIINVASVGGLFGCRAGAAYAASKHGIIGLTKNIGFMYAKSGIRCNAVCPGGVATEIAESGMNNPSQFGMERATAGANLNPRYGTPMDIANVALFLASDESSFVNGTSIIADAGWTAY